MNDQVVRDRAALQKIWADPSHWNVDGSYRCADDPRLLVRDRAMLGWTLNMGHRRAQTAIWSVLIAVIVGLGLLTYAIVR